MTFKMTTVIGGPSGFAVVTEHLTRLQKVSPHEDDHQFQTFVYRCKNGKVTDFTNIDFARYKTSSDAMEGHDAMVKKWKAGGA